MIRRARLLSAASILLALAGAACALRGHPVAGIVIIAVAVAIGGTAQRLHLRKESHR